MSQRRKFDKAFKLMTVELCLSGKSTTEVATELGLRPELVSRWKREYEQMAEALALLVELYQQANSDLYFGDESGFCLTPCNPYGW